jgi:hypothetical protein
MTPASFHDSFNHVSVDLFVDDLFSISVKKWVLYTSCLICWGQAGKNEFLNKNKLDIKYELTKKTGEFNWFIDMFEKNIAHQNEELPSKINICMIIFYTIL